MLLNQAAKFTLRSFFFLFLFIVAFLLYRFLISPVLAGNWNYFKPEVACIPLDEVIENNDPVNNEGYQRALVNLLKEHDPEDFRYYYLTRLQTDQYIAVSVRNDTTCFTLKLNTGSKDKLGGMLHVNGRAYPKELFGMKWEIKTVDGKDEVVYITMHDIID